MSIRPRMRFDIVTIFPDMFSSWKQQSLIGKAAAKKIIDISICDMRSFARDKHKTVDDKPFGGGPGMVMKIDPIHRALQHCIARVRIKPIVVLLSPQGAVFNHAIACDLARHRRIVLICGHYEGIDERITRYIDMELSIGDYVLTGGEIPAMAVIDAISRLIPGVVKEKKSVEKDSFFAGRLDYPHYTRPHEYDGAHVPSVLLSGHHARINQWRTYMSAYTTLTKRPDLLKRYTLTQEEKNILRMIKKNRKYREGTS